MPGGRCRLGGGGLGGVGLGGGGWKAGVISGGEDGEPEVYASFAVDYDAAEFRRSQAEFVGVLKQKHVYPLVGEIDRCLKKVSEGVEVIEDVWQKFQSAQQTAQKEKFEADLKKEIKKLQRLREQIKNWINFADINDKTMLHSTKNLIEAQMERFKAVEREMKIKAYSRVGLETSLGKVDPVTQEAEELNGWLVSCLEELGIQIDHAESEIESIHVNRKKRLSAEEQTRLDQLKARIHRHHFHINNIETLVRLLHELASDVNYCVTRLRRFLSQVNGIKEDVDYYLDANQNPDFEENELLYEDVDGIHEVEQVVVVGSAPLLIPPTDEPEAEASNSFLDSSRTSGPSSEASGAGGEDRSRVTGSASQVRTIQEHSKAPQRVHTADRETSVTSVSMTDREKGACEGGHRGQVAIPVPPPIVPTLSTTFKDVVSRSCVSDSNNNPSTEVTQGQGKVSVHVSSAWKSIPVTTSVSSPKNDLNHHHPHVTLTYKSASALAKPLKQGRVKEPPRSARSVLTTSTSKGTKSKERSSSVPGSSGRKLSREKLRSQNQGQGQQSQQGQSSMFSVGKNSSFSGMPSSTCSPRHSMHSTIQENVKVDASVEEACLRMTQSKISRSNILLNNSSDLDMTLQDFPEAEDIRNNNHYWREGKSQDVNSEPTPCPAQLRSEGQGEDKMDGVSGGRTKEMCLPPRLLAAPLGPFPLSSEHLRKLEILEAAERQMPLSCCSERLDQLLPRRPYPTPSYYPQRPMEGTDTLDWFRRLDMETLCFLFYYVQGSKAQVLAAKALKEKNWRFHTKYRMWFQRHDQPTITTDHYEKGTYIYFDLDEWGQRKKEGFVFEYQYLEDHDL